MGKIFRFVKKYWLLILISLTAVLFVVNKILETKIPTPVTPTPVTDKVANYRSIVLGVSTQDEVNELLGFPLKEQYINEKKVAEYSSTNEFRNHVVTIENGKVVLIKEIVNTNDNKNSSTIIDSYGTAPYMFYDQRPSATFNLYVYPTNGIAYLGHEDGTLLEIWYFEPTTIDNFINKWGEGYGKEESKVIPKY